MILFREMSDAKLHRLFKADSDTLSAGEDGEVRAELLRREHWHATYNAVLSAWPVVLVNDGFPRYDDVEAHDAATRTANRRHGEIPR